VLIVVGTIVPVSVCTPSGRGGRGVSEVQAARKRRARAVKENLFRCMFIEKDTATPETAERMS
jgi:hypothetical protein